MNTEKNKRKNFFSRMVVRLWLIMMALVLFTIGLMWVIQVLVMERNYINMTIQEIQDRLQPAMQDISTEDLARNESLLSYLSQTTNGKTILVDGNGELLRMYSYGRPIDLDSETAEIQVWEDIRSSESYQQILDGEEYTRETRKGGQVVSYEIGIPVVYDQEESYVILYQSFSELYRVLEMNRRQLIVFSILLTLAASVLAAVLSRSFVKPIHAIKGTVDELARGNLAVTVNLNLKDEVGQLADSVNQLGKALQRVDALRKEVIANVSHELQSPLALIAGYAEMVRDVHWKDQEKRKEDLDLIIRESGRMSEMVNDILDYSQLQAGYLQLRKDWYNLCEIVESEILLCEQRAKEYRLHMEYNFFAEEVSVYVDALKISQVIRNLLYNALNHTQEGLMVRAEIKEVPQGILVAIKNESPPIPEEERELIWERYQRSQHQGGRNEGTGLGLSIVSAILQAHEMPYGVDYEEGCNRFWFCCPRMEANGKSIIQKEESRR